MSTDTRMSQLKRLLTFSTLAFVGLLAIFAVPAIPEDNGKATISAYCSSHGDMGLSHGACVAYFKTHNIVPHDSAVCQDEGIWTFLGVANHGQCVKKLGEMRE